MPITCPSSHSVISMWSVNRKGPTRVSQSKVESDVNRMASASCIHSTCDEMSDTSAHTAAGGAQVRLEREAVVVLSRDVPLLGDELGRDPLGHETAALLVAGEHFGAERLAAGSERRAHRHPGHALDAGGDHDVVRPRDDALGGEVRGLLGGAALTVDGGADRRFREPGGEGGVAAHVDCLVPHLHDAAHDHVLDQLRVEAGALDQSVQRERGEINGVDVLERAVPPPLRGADGVDDDGRGHGSLLGY